MPAFHLNHVYILGHIATAHPQAGCRLVRLTFDRVLEQYHLKQDKQQNPYLRPYLPSELDTLNQGTLEEALNAISHTEPKLFIDTLLPWLEDILRLTQEPNADWPFYGSDDLSDGWHERTFVVRHLVIQAFITALTILARTQPEVFRQIAAHLAALPYQTPQQLLANVYQAVADMYTEDALQFLLADRRRLNLGDHQQYESRQLIKALYPFLASSQRATLESFICRYAPIWNWKLWGIVALNERGREQLHLLQTIPIEYLTEHGIHSLRELERKFPHVKVPDHPITSQGGFVGSPISADAARKMSDKAWLRAMQKYQGEVTHREFLKGGAYQLASVLLGLVKEEPERFYRLLERVPDTVDTSYVGAFINGLAESTAPAEWFYNVIRRFGRHPGRDIKRTIAYAIEKRIEAGVSDDVMALLESYIRDTSPELIDTDKDPHHGYINSDRGSALRVLMRALDWQKTPDATQRKWELIEFVVEDSATTLRAGAIEELLYLLSNDRGRAIALFERLMARHDALIHSHFTQDFLYYGMYKNFTRIKPFIRALLDEDDDRCKQQGAALACIAALSPQSLETPENLAEAQKLAIEAIDGPAPCRRGAALIYAHNITGEPSVICDQELRKLLNDEDTAVQDIISGVFRFMQSDHINTLREFIEAYAASRAFFKGTHEFTEYLWEHGLLDPAWTLSVVEIILNNEYRAEASPWSRGGEELVRLVLRIYTHPTTDAVLRLKSMDVFDKLMERYIGEAQMVLGEWDKR